MEEMNIQQRETLPSFKQLSSPPNITKIGKYKIETLLHKGSFSYLYLAKDPDSEKLLAIKILAPNLTEKKDLVERFLLEAEIIEKASHENIITVYESGRWEKGLYIAMEYIPGVSLTQFIKDKAFCKKRSLEIVLQICYGLMHLHSHKIIHRDLKPENILIGENGQVKIIDFGIAELQKSNRSTPGFGKNPVIGTPSYMSPEQKINPLTVHYNTDIYSLAIITYELLIGKLCFGKVNLSLIDDKLANILEQALKVDFHERTEDIVDFISSISSYLRNSPETMDVSAPLSLIQNELLPQDIPQYENLEIGFYKLKDNNSIGLYYEFFHLTDGTYFIFLANSDESNVHSLLPLINLRGIIHTLINPYMHSSNIKTFTLEHFTNELNQLLYNDRLHKNTLTTLLHINPVNETISHITSMEESIYHVPARGSTPRLLLNRTPPIGSSLDNDFYPTSDKFISGDICFIHSFSQKNLSEEQKASLEELTINTLITNKYAESNSLARILFNTLDNQSNSTLQNFTLTLYST